MENLPDQPDNQEQIMHASLQPKKRFKLKKWQLGLTVGLVVVAGGSLAYVFWPEAEPTDEKEQTNLIGTVADQEVLANAGNNLFFQVAGKIIAYDTGRKSPYTITNALPEYARVLDFYAGADGWRAYYIVPDQTTYDARLHYIENGTDTKVFEITDNYPEAYASARAKVLAYTLFPGDTEDDNPDDDTTRTYVVRGSGSPELVFESNPYEGGRDTEDFQDLSHALYNLDDISPDGTKLLFGRSGCYQCDGAGPGHYGEYDLVAKNIKYLDLGNVAEFNELTYADDGSNKYILHEYPNRLFVSVGEYEGFEIKLSKFTDPNKKTLVFEEKNSTWMLQPPLSPDLSLIAVKEYQDPPNWESRRFKGIFTINGTKIGNLTPLSFTAPEGYSFSSLSNIRHDCIGLASLKETETPSYTQQVGAAVVCKNGDVYTYTQLSETEPRGDSYVYAQTL